MVRSFDALGKCPNAVTIPALAYARRGLSCTFSILSYSAF